MKGKKGLINYRFTNGILTLQKKFGGQSLRALELMD
jgi:hypothetical protein